MRRRKRKPQALRSDAQAMSREETDASTAAATDTGTPRSAETGLSSLNVRIRRKKKAAQLTSEGRRRLARRRARILKVVVCIVLLLILAVPALFVNDAIGYVPPIAFALILAVNFVYIQILKRTISFSTNSEQSECTRSENIDFRLTITNKSILPAVRLDALFFMSDIFGGEGTSDTHVITLGPKRAKTFSFGIRFDHIGTYQVGIKEIVAYDLFGIFTAVHVNDNLTTVNVQPRIFNLDELRIGTDATVEAKKNFTTVINDGMDYSGVRDYHWGDPIKAIHWKLSARAYPGNYFTRLYETNANPGMAVIADFDAPEYTSEELMSIYDSVVETAFSLERYAATNGYDAELVFQDKARLIRRYAMPFTGNRQDVLDRMPQIFSPGTGREALGLVQSEVQSPFAQSNLLVITSVISKELIETLISARVGKRSPMLFAVIPASVSDERRKVFTKLLDRLGNVGIASITLTSASDLVEGS